MSGDNDEVRAELAELRARVARTLDADRPEAVARRRKTGQRTVRENLADLLDAGSLLEYGAASPWRRSGPGSPSTSSSRPAPPTA
jgi:acetyl-CoA carboxylase carboxyltransferase component